MNANLREREVSLILNDTGGAELIDNGSGKQLWASDSDDEFRQEFPDTLDENDVEHVLDYLCAHDLLSDDEADSADVLMATPGPGDEEDDDDEDEEDDGADFEEEDED